MTGEAFACRSCGGQATQPILQLGRTPLANSLLREEQLAQAEPTYPLDLVLCEGCGLVQITETVPPEDLFSDYVYFSSFSDGMLRSAEELAGRLTRARNLGADSLVVEAASNDGYLLQFYKKNGIPVLGVEPAANIARVAEEERQIPTLCRFFGKDVGQELGRKQRADVIHANNVLAHVPDPNGFVAGLAALVRDGGVCVVEVPSLRQMIEKTEFDTIYHEHLSYFSLAALEALFLRNGLRVVDVEELPLHGGSLRIFAEPESSAGDPSDTLVAMRAAETACGSGAVDYYRNFAGRVAEIRHDLRELLREIKSRGERIAVYGASAKGSTLLNYCEIGRETLDFVVDRSHHKQGLFTPGSHLLIREPAALLEEQPDYVLLATWNFRDEILEQQADYRARGGRFILPIPRVEVV